MYHHTVNACNSLKYMYYQSKGKDLVLFKRKKRTDMILFKDATWVLRGRIPLSNQTEEYQNIKFYLYQTLEYPEKN